MQATYGSTANNGIKTDITVVAGACSIRTTLPQSVTTSAGAGAVFDGLISRLDADHTKVSWWRVKLEVWNPNASTQRRVFLLDRLVNDVQFPLRPSDTTLSLAYSVELDPFWGGAHTISFANASVTGIALIDTDLVADPMDTQGFTARAIRVPAGSTEVRLVAYGGEGLTAKLLDGVALELPAAEWYAGVVDVCGMIDAAGEPTTRARCKYVERTTGAPWRCQLYTIHCDGHREGCGAYRANPGCHAWKCVGETLFPVTDGIMEISDATVGRLFDQYDGLGLVPWSEWRGTHLEWLEHYGAIMHGLTHPTRHWCHKFGTITTNALPCFASQSAGLPALLMQDRALWRYVKANTTLNTAMTKGGHVEVVLKGADIPLHNPADYGGGPDAAATAISGLEIRVDGSMQPRCYLPEDFPEGEYDVWAYCKHTLGFPVALVAESTLDTTGVSQPASRWKIPAAANYGWVQLTPGPKNPAPVLSPFMRLRFAVDPAGLGESLDLAAFNRAGEFAFKSLYLERVR
jgi:hypothetical protein